MKLGIVGRRLLPAILAVALAALTPAQETSTGDLKKDAESLREMVKAIQNDLQEIKANMARPAGPPSAVNQVMDEGHSPVGATRRRT